MSWLKRKLSDRIEAYLARPIYTSQWTMLRNICTTNIFTAGIILIVDILGAGFKPSFIVGQGIQIALSGLYLLFYSPLPFRLSPRLRGTISLVEPRSELASALYLMLSDEELEKKGRFRYASNLGKRMEKKCNRYLKQMIPGAGRVETAIRADVMIPIFMAVHANANPSHIDLRFTVWFWRVRDAVAFRLRYCDEIEFADG
jgi:hypothetical protein